METQSDPVREDEHEFASMLAGVLEEKRREGMFDRLVVVAGARMMGELRRALSSQVQAMIAFEVRKDLTRLPIAKLRKAVAEHREAGG
jgi:protein required for attachment to host cells